MVVASAINVAAGNQLLLQPARSLEPGTGYTLHVRAQLRQARLRRRDHPVQSNRFGGALRGKLLVCRYNVPGDIWVVNLNHVTVTVDTTAIAGFDRLSNPLDLVDDPRIGAIYVSEYGAHRITLLRPLDGE
jgi:hypothetical protein